MKKAPNDYFNVKLGFQCNLHVEIKVDAIKKQKKKCKIPWCCGKRVR